jgi:hypothetical protein
MSRRLPPALVLLPAAVALAGDPRTPVGPPPKGYVGYRAAKPVTIDGTLEGVWAAAPWSDPFVDIEGDARPRPRHRTRVKMLWDDTALYIAAELDEPHVWAALTEHDSVIFRDNDFEVFLDPDGDNHVYAELELNARNTTWDLLLTKPYQDGGRAINGWEITGLKTAVKVNGTLNDPRDVDAGWTVEIAWPWAGLKELSTAPAPPRPGDQWRINFSRVQWDTTVEGGKYVKVPKRPERNWVWSPQGVVDMHRPDRWGYLQFSAAEPGTDSYRPDAAAPVRETLHRVYYAQRAHRKAHGRYAATPAELGLKDAGGVRIETTASGFEATAAGPGAKRWHITQDARVWAE